MKCYQLNHSLSFFPERIDACCSGFRGPIYLENPTKSQVFDANIMQEIKKQTVEHLSNNIIPDGCKDCYELKDGVSNEDFSINKITLNHFTHCNCRCVYCARLNAYHRDFVENPQDSEYYDVLPIIKNLFDKNLIDEKRLLVDIQGGDLGVLKEFQPLVEYLLTKNFCDIIFTTNNIVYQPLIEKCIKLNKGTLITSLDCGSAETYLKMKRVDKFSACVENLRRYSSLDKREIPSILVKYILVRNFNDNLAEAQKFLEIMCDLKIRKVQFELDYNDILLKKDKNFVVPEVYYQIYELFKNTCAASNIELEVFSHTKKILDKGAFN